MPKSDIFRVTELEIIRQTDNFIEREFSVEKLKELSPGRHGDGEVRRIRHFQFYTWPNYGVPEAVKPISEFIVHVYNRMKGNIIIHLGKHILIYICITDIHCFAPFYHSPLKLYRI